MRICDCARFGLVDDVDLARLELRRGRHFGDERAPCPRPSTMPNGFSSIGISVAGVTSPTTSSVALSGR